MDLRSISDRARTTCQALTQQVKRESLGDTLLLSFSCGKESLAVWLAVRPYFTRIIPFYLYLVPGLQFVERSLVMYEEFFSTPILRLPHPSRFRLLRNRVFQPPDRLSRLEDLEDAGLLPAVTYQQLEDMVRDRVGDPTAYVALGVRARDSLNRWASYQKYGAQNRKRRSYYPVVEWTVQDVDSALEETRCPLPVDYLWYGRSFDGIDYRFLEPLSRHAPDDYHRILQDFPLAGLEIYRRHNLQLATTSA